MKCCRRMCQCCLCVTFDVSIVVGNLTLAHKSNGMELQTVSAWCISKPLDLRKNVVFPWEAFACTWSFLHFPTASVELHASSKLSVSACNTHHVCCCSNYLVMQTHMVSFKNPFTKQEHHQTQPMLAKNKHGGGVTSTAVHAKQQWHTLDNSIHDLHRMFLNSRRGSMERSVNQTSSLAGAKVVDFDSYANPTVNSMTHKLCFSKFQCHAGFHTQWFSHITL